MASVACCPAPTMARQRDRESEADLDMNEVMLFSPVATLVLSPSFCVRKVSHSLADNWNLCPSDCIGQNIYSLLQNKGFLIGHEETKQFKSIVQAAIDNNAVHCIGNEEIRRKSGTTTATATITTTNPPRSSKSQNPWSFRIIPIFRPRQNSFLSVLLEWTPQPQLSEITDCIRKPASCPSFPSHNGDPKSEITIDEAFSILIQGVKDYAIVMLDVHGNVATWNTGAELCKGYSRDEIIGKHFSIFYPPEEVDAGKPQKVLDECLRNGRIEIEGWRCRKDGSRFWANVIVMSVYKNGIHVGFGKVTRNLTERREAELRVAAAYEESAKLKSDFLANMSHEIRTPMHGMLSACSLLFETALTPSQREAANLIEESGQQLVRVINDILDYSKLASGTFSIHADVVGINSIVASVVRSVQSLMRPSLSLQLVLADNLPRAVQGDPLRYRQVLENILGNAIKFTDKGSIRVAVSIESQDKDTYVILTEVTDTGIGIPGADQLNDGGAALFEPFKQLDGNNVTSKRFSGLGLGLSISKSVVERMGGNIGFRENPEEQGSVFYFTARFKKIKSLAHLRRVSSTKSITSAITAKRPLRTRSLSRRDPGRSSFLSTTSSSSTSSNPSISLASSTASSTESTPASTPGTEPTSPSSPSAAASLAGQMQSTSLCSTKETKEVEQLEQPKRKQSLPSYPPSSPESAMARLRQQAAKKRLLIVEDNKINQRVLLSILQRLGFDRDLLLVAVNGAEAVEQLSATPPDFFDLILMDISMPVLDGYGATMQIRAQGHHSIPIVAMTAHSLPGDREQCLAYGMDDYISKPVDKQILVEKLLAWLPD